MTAIIDEFKKGLSIIRHPSTNTKKTMSVKEALAFYYKLSIIPFFIALIIGGIAIYAVPHNLSITNPFTRNVEVFSLGAKGILGILLSLIVALWVVSPISMLVSAGIMELIGKNWLNYFKDGYKGSFCAYVYASALSLIFVWLEYLGIVVAPFSAGLSVALLFIILAVIGVGGIVIFVIALANQQKISRLAALGIGVLTVVVIVFVVGVIVVISVLALRIGGNNAGSFFGTNCVANYKFSCLDPNYFASNGNITVIVGQNTGASWYNVAVAYAPAGTSNLSDGAPNVYFRAYPAIASNFLQSGQTYIISLNATAPAIIGSKASGTIWIAHTTSDVGIDCSGIPGTVAGCDYMQLAAVDLKAI